MPGSMTHAKYIATTPPAISEPIRDFCAHLEPNAEPIYVDHLQDDDADMGRCYVNVAAFCKRFGGEIQPGWAIWELPRIYMTAEHHAVVKLADGTLRDITPQLGNEKRILFLPSTLTWTGQPIINRYRPTKDMPLLKRICFLQERNIRLFHAGRMGCREWWDNDAEVTRLIDKFYMIQAQRETQKKQRRR